MQLYVFYFTEYCDTTVLMVWLDVGKKKKKHLLGIGKDHVLAFGEVFVSWFCFKVHHFPLFFPPLLVLKSFSRP